MASTKVVADWLLIEKDYRAGIKPLRQIAEEHGITHGAVNKRAKRDGWTRDLAAKIKAKAEEKVSKAAVSTEVSAQSLATERQVVEVNATLQATVRLQHRKDIARTTELFRSLLRDLEFTSENADKLEDVFDILNDPGDGGSDAQQRRVEKARKALSDVLSVPGRVDSGKRLTEMLEKLVRLEREAYGIDATPEGDSVAKSFTEAMLHARARALAA